MEAGIVGLPNVGKSTLFNALTMSKAAQSANYPFCTIEPNEGMVSVPDDRLARITRLIPPQKVIPAALKLVDIAGIGHFVAPYLPCAQEVIASFLASPATPNTSCVRTLSPPSFALTAPP